MTRRTWKIIAACGAALLLVVLLRGCVVTSFLIPSRGMENTLLRGERILVDKWSYGLRLPLMKWWGYHRWCYRKAGKEDIVLFNNPANLHEPVISRREVFIGRCTGTPGDTLLIDSLFHVAPSEQASPDQKFLYCYPRLRDGELKQLLSRIGLSPGQLLGQDSLQNIRSFSRYEYYLIAQELTDSCWVKPLHDAGERYRPFIIPTHGKPVHVTPWNITLLRNTLVLHEQRQAEIRRDTLYVEGQAVEDVTFCHDYYWITANNSINFHDSRLFGLVPHSHLIGRAALIWFSKDQAKGPFSGYRWERMGKAVK